MLASKIGLRITLVVAVGLSLTGCVGSKMVYPEDWAPLIITERDACQNITGKYRAISEPLSYYNRPCTNIGKGWYCRSLPAELLGISDPITEDTWVEIKGSNETELRIIVGTKNTIQDKITLRAATKQFECSEDGVVLKIEPEFMTGDGAMGINTGFVKSFRKATDGSLVMKEITSGGGLIFLVIPVAGNSTQWWKWQLLER
jgi:hypothetical protein